MRLSVRGVLAAGFLGVAGALLVPGPAFGAEVRLDPRGSLPDLEGEVVVLAQDTREVVTALPLGPRVELEATQARGLQVTCRGPAIWCPAVDVTAAGATLPLYPVMTVRASIPRRGIGAAVEEGVVQGLVHGERGSSVELRELVRVSEDGSLSFRAPRARLDLRFAFPGAAPIYRWELEPPSLDAGLAAGAGVGPGGPVLDLGVLALQTGGSMAGWVKRRDDELPVAGATVRASPVAGTAEGAPALLRWEETTGETGFFQLPGLPAGVYRLEVTAEGLVPQVVEALEVEPAAEALLGTVLLSPPIRLYVQVHPVAAPGGGAWTLTFLPQRPVPGEEPVTATTGPAGVAEAGPLRATEYFVQVGTSPMDVLLMEEHAVAEDGWLTLEVPVVRVEGTVRLGGEPIPARVVIETGQGDRVEIETDKEGRLQGAMRRPERPWLLTTVSWREGEAERRRSFEVVPEVDDDVAHLEIDLPAGVLVGQVVDPEGRPQPGVRVRATPAQAAGRLTEVSGETDRNGRFHLTGLDARLYQVRAGGNGWPASEVVSVDLSDDLPAGEIRLVVYPTRRLDAVVDVGGQPVAEAYVSVIGLGRVPVTLSAKTDAQGRAILDVPEELARAVVSVFAPSHRLWSACLAVDGEVLGLSLPTLPTGRLDFVTTGRSDLPPANGGQAVLLTGDGGFVDAGVLHNWARVRDAERDFGREGDRARTRFGIPGLSPGSYGIIWSAAPSWELAARTCAGGFPEAEWTTLSPGGKAELVLDLEAVQREALRGLMERKGG